MAETAPSEEQQWKKIDQVSLKQIKSLVWGDKVTEEVFLRWTQGLSYSEAEPSALIQTSGGPCAVIAPLQAYIIKNLIFTPAISSNSAQTETTTETNFNELTAEEVARCMGRAVTDILGGVSAKAKCILVTYTGNAIDQSQGPSTSSEDGESNNKRPKLFSFDSFHELLKYRDCLFENIKDLIDWYMDHLSADFGVLSLLYSIILTCGLDKIKLVVEDTGEPLIDPTYGHGGQCLINLLLTGEATAQVFDGEKDAGGLKLQGISKQSQIGFLSLIEAHRYLEVGWNLKSPVFPIWLLASESHLTVIFSKDVGIVAEDKQTEVVRVINSYDTEGNGFINTANLTDLMSALNLVSEPEEYIQIIKEKLDSEGLGIFLVSSFMEEFFSKTGDDSNQKQSFELLHYNGIKRSNESNKIVYHKSKAKLRDFLETAVMPDDSQIFKCLQTKWPTIELEWIDCTAPSLN